ncbi:MAG: homoserine dehydrogenase [Victivallaceae bacterium]|nr:homoserine dehydrogenase [Victivallaceae bacterium]
MKEVKVSVIGFGTVGAGVVDILLGNADVIATRTGVVLKLTRIADLDIKRDRGVKVPDGVLTTDSTEAIEAADVVIELIGGTTIARKIILQALNAGKSVVTANKALLAHYGAELFEAARKNGVDLFYEASVGGGIPIIKALREGLAANRINRICGILNGTCNYILTRMENEHADFASVLADAQKLGYAEANPSLDIDGFDTAHKTVILASLACGRWFGMDDVHVEGINGLDSRDIEYAAKAGYRIKLLGIIKNINGAIQMRVHPTLVATDSMIANISDVFNGVMVEGDMVGRTLFYGRGAGRQATASAVVADIIDIGRNLIYGTSQRVPCFKEGQLYERLSPMDEIESRYYLRFTVDDCPGVVAGISKILSEHSISIASLIQEEHTDADGSVPLVVLTHPASEKEMKQALEKIGAMPFNRAPVRLLRIETI